MNVNAPIGGSTVLSRVMSVSPTTWMIIGVVVFFTVIAILYYIYYITPKTKYHANGENAPSGNGTNAELMFFFADWCPHCKAAKPIWNDIKAEYETKLINGYRVVFTEIDCSQDSPEVEKLVERYNVEGYPTLKLVKDGQVIEYDAKVTHESLTKFLNTVL